MKKKIFLRFFLVTLVTALLMFSFGIVAVNLNAKNIIKNQLVAEAELVTSLIVSKDDFNKLSRYEGNDEFRITIFDTSGNVLYESETNSPLENHANREEIKNALADTPRTVERYSDTFKCKMTYYAIKSSLNDSSEIVVRLAIKSSEITSYINVTLPLLIVVLLISIVISFIMSNILSKNISSKITEIGKSLRSLNEGKYEPLRTDTSEPEIYSVLGEINELNASTHTHINLVRQEHKKLNTVLDTVAQGIIAINQNNELVFVNKSALEIFNGCYENKGKGLIYLIDNLELYNKILDNINESYAFEYSYNGRDLSVALRKITDSSLASNISSILIITDITQENAISKQKSDFFANTSHELKTPITVMQGLSEILLDKDIDEISKKQIERIHKESVRLSSLISDMLKLSKLERGEMIDVISVPVNLRHVAEEVFSELNEEMNKKNISATIEGNGIINGDPKRIFELIQNLSSNAVNYNRENGTILLSIKDNTDSVTLSVKDSGIGIEKEHIPRLCERFYRVDKSRSKKTGGTGLGLAIVKHICALYNAELKIDSDIGIGTTVTIIFRK